MEIEITYRCHPDRIHTEKHEVTSDFKVSDMVVYIPNGLTFRVENKKMLSQMIESGNYVKIIKNAP